jgi:hypothetical protein
MPATKTGITTDTTTHPMVFVGDSDPINQFIEWPIIRPDGAYQPIQYPVTGQLLCNGVGHENLKAAALVSTCMLSSMLGYPISAMLAPEDAQGAIHLVDQCLRLIPHEAVIEIPELKPEHLFIDGGKRLDGKCIVSPTENGFNKVERDLELILTRGRTIRQELTRGKFEVGFSEHRSVMRVSILGIDYGRLGKRLNLPSVLKIPVTSNGATELPGKSEVADQYGLNNSPLFKIRKSFQRLKQRTVVIPYEQQLGNAMANNGCDHVSAKLEVMKNLISILAITNQPLPLQMAELGAMIYGTDEKEVGRWLIDTGLIKDLEPMPVKPVVATKVDYYLARLLLDGVLLAGPTRYTDRQRRVFETVKAINMGKMTSTILTKGDEVEVLGGCGQKHRMLGKT